MYDDGAFKWGLLSGYFGQHHQFKWLYSARPSFGFASSSAERDAPGFNCFREISFNFPMGIRYITLQLTGTLYILQHSTENKTTTSGKKWNCFNLNSGSWDECKWHRPQHHWLHFKRIFFSCFAIYTLTWNLINPFLLSQCNKEPLKKNWMRSWSGIPREKNFSAAFAGWSRWAFYARVLKVVKHDNQHGFFSWSFN